MSENSENEQDAKPATETKSLLAEMKADLEEQVPKEDKRSSGKSKKVDGYKKVLRELFIGQEDEDVIGSPVRYKDIRDMMTEIPFAAEWPKATGKVKRRLDDMSDILYERVGYEVPDEPERDIICMDANSLVEEWQHKDASRPVYIANPRKFSEDETTKSLGFEPSGDQLLAFAMTERKEFLQRIDEYFDKEPDEDDEEAHKEWAERQEEKEEWYRKITEALEDKEALGSEYAGEEPDEDEDAEGEDEDEE